MPGCENVWKNILGWGPLLFCCELNMFTDWRFCSGDSLWFFGEFWLFFLFFSSYSVYPWNKRVYSLAKVHIYTIFQSNLNFPNTVENFMTAAIFHACAKIHRLSLSLWWPYTSRVKRICVFKHAYDQPFRRPRDLAFCLKVPLDSLLVWASSGGSGETARMRRLAWTFAARIGDIYQIRLTRPILCMHVTKYVVKITLFYKNLSTMADSENADPEVIYLRNKEGTVRGKASY